MSVSIYKSYSQDEIDNMLSQFLVDNWSYSKVTQFARNEKAFELTHIYNQRSKSSATTIAGQAYHFALDRYFTSLQAGEKPLDLVMLEKFAFDYLDEIPVQILKLQKTTPTIEECKLKANKTVTLLLNNFFSEISSYRDEIKEVLDIEVFCDEWLTINGVDIPLPCKAKIDLVVETKEGKLVIIDHKSKTSFSDEQDLKFGIGIQAITYVKAYEEKTGLNIDEVWFAENKISKNKDGSKQINVFKVKIDKDVRRMYEALLYEPLKRMISAVNDPDYIYLINDSDNLADKAELYEFWAKTMIAEIEEFNVDPKKKDMIEKRLKKIRDVSIATVSPTIIRQFKKNASEFIQYDLSNKDMNTEQKIEHALRTFGITTEVAYSFSGYSSNTFLLQISAGVKVASIAKHRLDIANVLDVSNVRISQNLVVYKGKSFISIEFSKKRDKTLEFNSSDLVDKKIPIGKDNYDNIIYWDLENHSTPHVLMCGATGSGKSVCIKSTMEFAKGVVSKIVVLDPKFEFTHLKKNPRFEVYNDILEIEEAMAGLVEEMNELVESGGKRYTLVVFDEFADAVANARKGKELDIYENVEVGFYKQTAAEKMMGIPLQPKYSRQKTGELKSLEENLKILLQKGRSSGFRIIAATQRASVKVITGDAKANLPVQICFRVPKEIDSKVVLDETGAESLSGMGDGLIKSPEYMDTVRFQAYFKS